MSSTSSVCAAVPLISAAARGVAARPSTRRLAPRSRSSASARSSIRAGGSAAPAIAAACQSSTARLAWWITAAGSATEVSAAPSADRVWATVISRFLGVSAAARMFRASVPGERFRSWFQASLFLMPCGQIGNAGRPIWQAHSCPLLHARGQPITMNFDLSAEHQAFAESVSRFAKDHLAPAALARAHAATYPWETAALLARQGLLGITLPEADGGQGGSLMHAVLAIEQVALVCPRSADIVQAGNFGALRTFAEYASAEQKARFLPDLLAGRKLMALAMTEPDAG